MQQPLPVGNALAACAADHKQNKNEYGPKIPTTTFRLRERGQKDRKNRVSPGRGNQEGAKPKRYKSRR